jgi:hypothetical protein
MQMADVIKAMATRIAKLEREMLELQARTAYDREPNRTRRGVPQQVDDPNFVDPNEDMWREEKSRNLGVD